ncbi:MAG: phage head morphogenesis protein [Nitrosopumilus sp.]|nr:phage head morphogenesis protein [Nitrosopumilus sp.]
MASCQIHNISLETLIASSISKELASFFNAHTKSFDKNTSKFEKQFIKQLRVYFKEQEAATLKALHRKSKSIEDAERALADKKYWADLLKETLDDIYNDIVLTSGAATAQILSGSFDILNPDVLKMMYNKLDKIVDINITTEDAIKLQLQRGIDAGDSINLMAMRIQSVFDDASNYRATTIARTEVIGTYNGTSYETYRQNDIEKNQWLATLDGRDRPDHADAHMMIARVDKGFNVGGEILMFPGDPSGSAGNIINCRCTTIAIID